MPGQVADKMMRGVAFALALMGAAGSATPATAQEARKTPYWASIAAGDALMRAGPGRNYPATWRYRRADLPIKVIETYPNWRRIEDPDGTVGWMAVALLSDQRTGIVRGEVRPLRTSPERGARIVWRVAPGVVGRVSHCRSGWCEFDVQGRQGHIEVAHIWGVSPDETID
jgi:SH3-like domain-containing protein